jgi:hypothetical protein
MEQGSPQVVDYESDEWIVFPGGELEGKRPRRLCPSCRAAVQAAVGGAPAKTPQPSAQTASAKTLCFQCYRADVERDRALKAAGELNAASEERFQSALPFETVNRPRLEMLKAERSATRTAMRQGTGRFEDRRRRAQLAARHALQRIAAGSAERHRASAEHALEMAAAIHAAELQLPESWMPFVVSR